MLQGDLAEIKIFFASQIPIFKTLILNNNT